VNNKVRLCVAFTVSSWLAACSTSPPMRYYTLSVIGNGANENSSSAVGAAPGTASAAPLNASGVPSKVSAPGLGAHDSAVTGPIHVGRISIPGEIDRTQLVSRIDANRLRVSDMDRWAAPLDEMIRRTLTADLIARMPAGAVSDLDEARTGQKPRVLSLNIQEFHGEADCSVTLRASWILTLPNTQSALGTNVVRVPSSGTCPDALPAAMSQALADLSMHIAAALASDAKLTGQ